MPNSKPERITVGGTCESGSERSLKQRIEDEMVVDPPRGFDQARCDDCGHVAYLPENHPDGVVSCTNCSEGVLSRVAGNRTKSFGGLKT